MAKQYTITKVILPNIISQLPTNDGGVGEIATWGGGSGFTAGEVRYLNSLGNWDRANASSTTDSINMLAIALGSTPSAGMLIRGYAKFSAYTFTSGDPLYLSATTGGAITSTAPSSTGEVVRIIGYSTNTSDIIYFNPDPTWVTL